MPRMEHAPDGTSSRRLLVLCPWPGSEACPVVLADSHAKWFPAEETIGRAPDSPYRTRWMTAEQFAARQKRQDLWMELEYGLCGFPTGVR